MGKVDSSFDNKLNENIDNFNVNEILNSYLETAFWTDEDIQPELKEKSFSDVDINSINQAKEDIKTFLQQAKKEATDELEKYDSSSIGHNFWLSRNGHGAGFFDDYSDKLQEIAEKMETIHIYVGDDGKVYMEKF